MLAPGIATGKASFPRLLLMLFIRILVFLLLILLTAITVQSI